MAGKSLQTPMVRLPSREWGRLIWKKWSLMLPSARVAMEAGTHSIWISQQLEELGHRTVEQQQALTLIRACNVPLLSFLLRNATEATRNARATKRFLGKTLNGLKDWEKLEGHQHG